VGDFLSAERSLFHTHQEMLLPVCLCCLCVFVCVKDCRSMMTGEGKLAWTTQMSRTYHLSVQPAFAHSEEDRT